MKTPIKQKRTDEKKKRVRLMLLAGKKLTKRFLDRTLDVTNSAEIIRTLRREMEIDTIWKVSKNGVRYGEYVYKGKDKKSRISSGEYKGFSESGRYQRV